MLRPKFLTYRSPDGAVQTLVMASLAGFQAVQRDADVFGVVVIASGGASIAMQEVMTVEQANTVCEYIRGHLVLEGEDPTRSLNLNLALVKIKERLPDKQILTPDDNVVGFKQH